MQAPYDDFLSTHAGRQWKRIGPVRRGGVATPLFSVFSEESVGVGEIPDLVKLSDWCRMNRMSLIQLLPLNDMGSNFRPYDAESTFALDPVYLCLDRIQGIGKGLFEDEIRRLREDYPCGARHFNVGIKEAKLRILWEMFGHRKAEDAVPFEKFVRARSVWIRDYALYRVLKEMYSGRSWEEWPEEHRRRDPAAVQQIEWRHARRLEFHEWLQWQLFLQMEAAREAAVEKGVLVIGDMPLLVARDSADVWAHPEYFELDKAAGAPPDAFFAGGQRWGMPPYSWDAISRENFRYVEEKLRAAEHFYDLFRIDHVVGLFRIWVFPEERFDPPDETRWEAHGRKILSVVVERTRMLPCAEDLGTVPEFCAGVLQEFGIPGAEIVRWTRHWKTDGTFKRPEEYRKNAAVVFSTHDTPPLAGWWLRGVDAEERKKFLSYLGWTKEAPEHASLEFIEAALDRASSSASIFSVQLLQDWLSLEKGFPLDPWNDRINFPGTVSDRNWTLVMPYSLEKMKRLSCNRTIRRIHERTGRT